MPLLEHHNIPLFGVNVLNGESIIRYPFPKRPEILPFGIAIKC